MHVDEIKVVYACNDSKVNVSKTAIVCPRVCYRDVVDAVTWVPFGHRRNGFVNRQNYVSESLKMAVCDHIRTQTSSQPTYPTVEAMVSCVLTATVVDTRYLLSHFFVGFFILLSIFYLFIFSFYLS